MLDDRTKLLKEKISSLKSADGNATNKSSAAEDFKVLIIFVIKLLSVYGSQYFILNKIGIAPFSIWESAVIHSGIVSIVSIFKSK